MTNQLSSKIRSLQEIGHDRPCKSASYNVQSLLDGQKYTAVFATSDVDKVRLRKLKLDVKYKFLVRSVISQAPAK